jgi:hypothetical protein
MAVCQMCAAGDVAMVFVLNNGGRSVIVRPGVNVQMSTVGGSKSETATSLCTNNKQCPAQKE